MRIPPTSGRPRRYAFVSDAVYPYNKGGKETRVDEITKRLSAKPGVECTVYTMKWWDGPTTVRVDGITYRAISRLWKLYSNDRRSMLQAMAFALATLRLMFADFDVLDVDHMPFFPVFSARLVGLVKRRPVVGTWHEVWGSAYWYSYMGRFGFFGSLAEKLSIRMPHLIVANSDHTACRLQESFPGVPVETVSLGVDYARIDSVPPAVNGADVVFAGRLLENKNVDLLLDAIALLSRERPALRCLVIGEGPERRGLEAQAARLGLQGVEFSEFVPEHDDLIATLKASRALVLPSEREGFGLVIAEANACGLPVVTLDHPNNAARHLVNPGMNGYLCSKSPVSLAGAIARALDRGLSSDWHRPGQYDWSVVADRVDHLLQSVVA